MAVRKAEGNQIVDISGELSGPETDKAFQFYDGKTRVWLPKSQCEWDAETKTMAMPFWLAIKKGLI